MTDRRLLSFKLTHRDRLSSSPLQATWLIAKLAHLAHIFSRVRFLDETRERFLRSRITRQRKDREQPQSNEQILHNPKLETFPPQLNLLAS